MVIFCKNCSKKIEYRYKKPEKCQFCGASFFYSLNKKNNDDFPASVEAEVNNEKKTKLKEDGQNFDFIDNDGFYNKDYRPGQFNYFLSASKTKKLSGVSIEIDKPKSIKMKDLLNSIKDFCEGDNQNQEQNKK